MSARLQEVFKAGAIEASPSFQLLPWRPLPRPPRKTKFARLCPLPRKGGMGFHKTLTSWTGCAFYGLAFATDITQPVPRYLPSLDSSVQ